MEEPDLRRVLDGGAAIAKKARVSDPKTESVKSRDVARAIVIYARKTTLTTMSSEQVATARWRG